MEIDANDMNIVDARARGTIWKISTSPHDSNGERLIVLTDEELAGLRAILEDPSPSTNALLKAFAQPDPFTFENS